MELFEQQQSSLFKPLADQLRPQTLEDFVGQRHILGKGKMLLQLIETENIPSMIFWGATGFWQDNACQNHCQSDQAQIYHIERGNFGNQRSQRGH